MKISVENVTNRTDQGKGKIPELNDNVEKLDKDKTIRRGRQEFQIHVAHRKGQLYKSQTQNETIILETHKTLKILTVGQGDTHL